MTSCRRPLGALLIAAAIAIWFFPALELPFLQPQTLPADQFQLLAFPKRPCGETRCLSRAANFSLAEWNSGNLTVVQSDADLNFSTGSFTLFPPANADEMIAAWRATLKNQGFDGGEYRARTRGPDLWEIELVMRDDLHSRSSRFSYVLKANGDVLPEKFIEYSWVDHLSRGAAAAVLVFAGASLLWRRAKPAR